MACRSRPGPVFRAVLVGAGLWGGAACGGGGADSRLACGGFLVSFTFFLGLSACPSNFDGGPLTGIG